jgi:hypothetical protein
MQKTFLTWPATFPEGGYKERKRPSDLPQQKWNGASVIRLFVAPVKIIIIEADAKSE